MATLPTINSNALKVTFPANLPRNEKDLICMLLAGRLKDLWRGRLVCVQLAIDDLIKDVTGVSGLGALRDSLLSVKSSLNGMRQASGYDKILGKVNSALGQVNQVFSLGGLCPSPVQAPRIPDILSTLNQNLFGQANGILNALAQASNPKVCLGGGPKGFSLDWRKVTGDLALLKGAINQFKRDPAGFSGVMSAFEQNLKNQSKRLNSEITRLEKNLTDPLGINDTKNTVGAIKRVKSISDDYPVKDRNGVEYKNPTRMMIPAEVDYVLSRTDPIYTAPIKYTTVPVLDYCGNVVGYEKKIVTGDINYAGWDPNNDAVNNNTPTINPVATASQFDFTFIEENNTINVYNDKNKIIPTIELVRGKHYRFGLKLTTKQIKIYKEDNSVWYNGLTLTKEPDYGKGFEIVAVDTTSNLFGVEFDWAVSIENPTTPNRLFWSASSNLSGTINISGITEMPETDKTYDISMAAKKAWMHLYKKTVSIPTGGSISHEETYVKRRYNMSANIIADSGSWSKSEMVTYGSGYTVLDDDETIDDNGEIVVGNKISRWVLQLSTAPLRYLIIKKYYNETSGIKINQVSCYIADSLLPEPNYFESLASLKYDEPIELLNDITLPYTDFNEYKLALLSDGKLTNNDEFKIELLTEGSNKFFIINLTTNRENSISSLPVNEFVYTSKIKFDPTDYSRNFINSDPREERTFMHFKGNNGLKFECIIEYLDDAGQISDGGGNTGGGTGGNTGGGTGGNTGGGGSADVWYFNGTACVLAQGGFVPGPATTFSTLQACQAANNGDGTFGPTPNMLYGRDYYTYNSPEPNTQPEYIDLRNKNPIKVTYEPLEPGKGVGYEWLVDGKSFQTGIFYTEELTNPRHWAFGKLSNAEAQPIRTEYINSFNPPLDFILSPGEFNSPNSIPGFFWNNFLVSKGIGPTVGSTFTSTHGDVYTWNGSSWDLTTPWTRP